MPFEMEQVVGSGSVQQLICQTIQFQNSVEEIKEIRKTVIIDNCLVVHDKVIVDGRLRKDIMYKQADTGFALPGNTQACSGIVGSVSGPIFDLDLDIAFNALIPVPGAQPGDKCVIIQAFVEGEKEEAAEIQPTGAFTALIDKSIVFICAKAVRDVITNGMVSAASQIAAAQAQPETILCPQRPSTGFYPGGNGTIPNARRGLVQGTWIGPTLVFPGVLNPGIPTTLPLPNQLVNGGGTLVQIAQPGFTPGTDGNNTL